MLRRLPAEICKSDFELVPSSHAIFFCGSRAVKKTVENPEPVDNVFKKVSKKGCQRVKLERHDDSVRKFAIYRNALSSLEFR